jgi:hypothetical protein
MSEVWRHCVANESSYWILTGLNWKAIGKREGLKGCALPQSEGSIFLWMQESALRWIYESRSYCGRDRVPAKAAVNVTETVALSVTT